ncbi:type I restriction enzyme, S subunit [Nitrosospira briensis]|uniref:Type I restriction enzyme, S subunit n=1 Tax=Nitrosospira briensis TaxID=35799 RepID=A0A1I5EDB7_9PROT|nr:restriction endonuclease subunit S [Nitrosospira briensis]SFO09618.1 type I restriction enzyme, S subunit [Nitrosospira briensis]
MSKENNKKWALVPRLRFPEFRDREGWTAVPMGSLLARNPEYGVNAPAVPYSKNLPTYFRITDINEGGRFLSKTKVSVDIAAIDDNYLELGDIVLARTGASVGKSYRYRKEDGRLVFAGFLIRIKPEPKKVNSIFLANFLTTNQYWSWVDVASARSGQPGINGTEYSSLLVPVPSSDADGNGLSEQQRIAGCLSSIDELIMGEIQKLDTLKTYKKGLMQQLFPREGETVPRLRFPEFQNAGRWAVAKLGEKSTVVRGGSPRPIDSYLTHEEDGLNWLKIGDVDKESKFIEKTEEKVIPAALGNTRQIHPGDLILSNSMSFGRPYISKIVSCIHDGWLAITDIREQVSPEFLYYVLCSSTSQVYFQSLAAGSGVKNLNADTIKQLAISFPGRAEQLRISDCFAYLDDLIARQIRKITLLRQHKQGLMQSLFPTVDIDAT